jgi:hypothetical protein
MDFRALVLLHELGHLTGKFPEDAGKELDLQHTAAVKQNCLQ